ARVGQPSHRRAGVRDARAARVVRRRGHARLHPASALTTERRSMSDLLRPDAADALEAWRRRVSVNREQAERLREGAPPRDFYAAVASDFGAHPRRADEPALELLRALVRPGESWLDIRARGGRSGPPLGRLGANGHAGG